MATTPEWIPNGIDGGAYEFDGSSSFIELSQPLGSLFSSSFTVSMWAYFDDDSRGVLFGDYQRSNAINVNIEKHTNRRLRLYWNGAPDIFTPNNSVNLNEWQLVSFVRDKVNSKVLIYVNGNLVHTYSGALSDKTASGLHLLGRDDRTGTTALDGNLDDVRIYSQALTPTEIADLYNNSASLKITVVPAFTAGAIATTGQTICYGGNPSIIGNVTLGSGGSGPIVYQWQTGSGVITGATSSTYDPPSGLTSTTTYTRWVKDDVCSPSYTQSTGSWTVNVLNPLTAGTISSSQTICYNTAPTALTGTAATGGTNSFNPQWQSSPNGTTWSDISGATSIGYAPGALTATTHYRRVDTDAGGECGVVNSNSVTITVGNSTTVGGGSSSPTVCVNNAIPNITHSIPSDVTGITNILNLPAGVSAVWSSGLITISGTPTTSVGSPFNYSIELIGGCLNGAKATGEITVTPSVGAISFSAGPTTVCQDAVNSTYTATTASGTGTITYSVSPAGAGSINSSTGVMDWSASFSGAATITATATGCNAPTPATRNVTVTPSVGAISFSAGPTTVCQDAVNSTYTATTASGTGTIAYSVSPAGAGSINSSTGVMDWSASFSGAATITATATGCNAPTPATRNVTVTPSVGAISFSAGPTSVCQDAVNSTYTATTASGTGTIAYSVSPAAAGSINSSTGVMDWSASFSGAATITATATGCNAPAPATRSVTVNPALAASVSISASASTICPGTSVTFTATPTNGGTTPSYQWKVGGSNVGTNSNTYTSTTLTNGNVVTVAMTSNATCATGSPATSNGITMSVISPTTPVMSVTDQPTCATPGGIIQISSPLGAAYEYALNGGTYQTDPVFTGLAPGNYSATVRLVASPACVSTPNASLTINSQPVALPAMDPVYVCQGGTGYLVSNNNCIENFVVPFVENSIYYGWSATGDPTAAVPSGAANTTVCSFGGPVRTYSIVEFQVATTTDYIFEMNDNPAYNGVGYIYTGNFTPGVCGSGTLVRADNDGGVGNEPKLGSAANPMTLTAGVTYSLVSSTEGPSDVTAADYTWTITSPSGGKIMLNEPGSVQWYTAATGGSPIYTGQNFNPVGVPGSGISNTNTAITRTYYAACSSSPSCRTAATFEVTNTTTLYNITPGGSSTCYDSNSSISIGISGSLLNMPYRLYRDGADAGSQATGTGSAITVGSSVSGPGIYTVVAVIGNTCVIPMNGSVEVKPAPIANAGPDVTLCSPTLNPVVVLSGSSNPTTIATENFGSANMELTPSTSDWRLRYLYNTHPGNRTQWWTSYSGANPYSFTCVGSGSGLVMVDNRQFQSDVPCDYAWDAGIMDEIAYKITPMDARLYTSVNVSFDYLIGGNYSGSRNPQVTDYMQVVYSLDNGTTWTAVNAGNNTGTYTLRNPLSGATNAFFSKTGSSQTGVANVSMPVAVTGKYFLLGFRWTNDGSTTGDYVGNLMIDNIVVSGAASYSWSPTTGVTGANTASPTITTPETYTVTVTAGNGCTATDEVVVKPRADITSFAASTCSGAPFDIEPLDGTNGTVPSATTYSWSAPTVTGGITGGAASSGTPTNITGTLVNPTSTAQTATYTVTPTANGCNGPTFTLTMTVNPKPAISAMTASTCSPSAFTVTPANGTNGIIPSGTTYSWTAPTVTGGMTGGAASTGSPTSITGALTNPTAASQTATYTVTATSGNCSSTPFTVTVSVSPSVTTPTAITYTGTEPTCQLTSGSSTDYNSTVDVGTLSWSLTGITSTTGSISAGAINVGTGVVTWPGGWSGSVTVNVVSTACNGSSTPITRTVTVTPAVGIPTAIIVSAGSEPPCQLTNATTTTTYSTTATNSSGFNWSLSNSSAGSINATTGVMTWADGFSGSVDIQVTATGCNGQSIQVTRPVNISPPAGIPTAITYTGTEPSCQITNSTPTTTYSTTATNSSSFNWSLSDPAAGTINSSGVMTWANGYYGTVTIRVTANGCSGASAEVTRVVNIGIGVLNAGFRTWTGTALNHLWQDNGNWDCGGVPTATDAVIIPEVPLAGQTETPRIENGIVGDCHTIWVQGNIADRIEIETGGVLKVHQ